LLSSIAMYNSHEIFENYERNWTSSILWTFGIPKNAPNAKELATKIKEIYFPQNLNLTKDQKLEQLTKMFSDAYFMLHISHCISVQRQFSPVYPYFFSRRGGPSLTRVLNLLTRKGSMPLKIGKHYASFLYNKITGNKPRDYGVCHGDELAMLFNIPMTFYVPRNPHSADYKFSKDMVQLWVDFTRDPTSMRFRGAAFSKQDPEKPLQYFELCENPKVIDGPFKKRVDALESLHIRELYLPLTTKSMMELKWRGIPFGKAPIGPLRFASPVPFGKWEGVRDGSKFGGRCPEISGFGMNLGDEDCLNLNVSVPKVNSNSLLPVMVFIHGGAFQNGTGSMYRPDYFMDEDVVYVNPNYRLGIFGFLNTGDTVIRGNMGLKDQVLALRWVKDNIQAFGGDPNNVTIFGESAGAASIHHLTLSPSTKGLFSKAIIQSGDATPHWACKSTKNAVKYTKQYAKRFNCDTEDSSKLVECLRSKTVPELLEEYKDELGPGLLSSLAMYNSYEIAENYEKNWDNCIRWTFGIPEDTPNAKELTTKMKEIYFSQNSNLTKDQKLEQFTKLFSDAYFLLHMSHLISVQRQFSPIYPYYFSRRGGPSLSVFMDLITSKGSMPVKIAKHVAVSIYNKITGNKPRDYGVCHADELAMIFNVEKMFYVPRNPQSADYNFSKDMVKLWVDFARDPTSMTFRGVGFSKLEPGKPVQYLELCEDPKMVDEPFKDRVDALKSLGLIDLRLAVATK
ncbi:unnamed protein product, partial [Allacma fusca]